MAPRNSSHRTRDPKKPDPRKKPPVEYPKTDLKPGQRAITQEQRKQRAGEKVERNRLAAERSRAKKNRQTALDQARMEWQEAHIAELRHAISIQIEYLDQLLELADPKLRGDLENSSNTIRGLLSEEFVFSDSQDASAQDAPTGNSVAEDPAVTGVENGQPSSDQSMLPTPPADNLYESPEYLHCADSQIPTTYTGNMKFSDMTAMGGNFLHDSATENSAVNNSAINSSAVSHAPSWLASYEATTLATSFPPNAFAGFTSSNSNTNTMLSLPEFPPNPAMDNMIMSNDPWTIVLPAFDPMAMTSASASAPDSLGFHTFDDGALLGALNPALNRMDPYADFGIGQPGFNDFPMFEKPSLPSGIEA